MPTPDQTFQEDPERAREDDDEEESESVPTLNNSDARLQAEREALEKWCQLQDQEDDLLQKYIIPVRERKAKVKSDLKKDYDIPTEAFNARAGLRRIERKKDGDEVLLAINELFKATPVGANVDMIAVAERVAAKKAEEAKAAEVKKTKARGTEAEV